MKHGISADSLCKTSKYTKVFTFAHIIDPISIYLIHPDSPNNCKDVKPQHPLCSAQVSVNLSLGRHLNGNRLGRVAGVNGRIRWDRSFWDGRDGSDLRMISPKVRKHQPHSIIPTYPRCASRQHSLLIFAQPQYGSNLVCS